MPDWLTLLLPILGAIVVGALGGVGGIVAWRQFRHRAPIESQEAMHASFQRQIASAEKRGDGAAVGRLQKNLEEQEEAWRAQQGVRSRTSPGPLTVDQPIQLAPEELAELRHLLQASQPLLMLSALDYLSRGNAYFDLREYGKALEAYDRAIALRPDDPDAHNNRGVALGRLGRHQEALAAYDRAIALRPDLPEAHINRGEALGNLGRIDEALAASDRAIGLRPDLPEAHSNRGVALRNLGRYDEALAAYDRAIGLRLDLPEAHYNRGVALGNLGRYDEALAAYDRAIALGPDLVEPVYNKACSLSRLECLSEALEWLARAIAGDQENKELARTDPDFQPLREHPEHGPRFWALVGQQ